ncbi:MAG TPA: sulfur transferase domain-containing protein [Coleofasciculaceae cyanobacterium]
MKAIKKINEDLAIAGQITPDQLQQMTEAGYKSVLNLRSPNEMGFASNEQQNTKLLGLQYFHIPTQPRAINLEIALQIIEQINSLPKPLVLHCDNGLRSATLAVVYVYVKQGMAIEQAFQKAVNLDFL